MNFREIVTGATLVSQNNRLAVSFAWAAALILAGIFDGLSPLAAAADARQQETQSDSEWHRVDRRMKFACTASDRLSAHDATLLFGQSCQLESSFTVALQTALHHCDDFSAAVTATANAGGDSAGRAAMIGAWLGAYHGVAGIPEGWLARLTARVEIAAYIERIVILVESKMSGGSGHDHGVQTSAS